MVSLLFWRRILLLLLILTGQHQTDVNEYASLLHFSAEFRISEIPVECEHWLCDKQLGYSKLRDEGLNLLAISRKDGTFLGAPDGDARIQNGDTLIIYGRAEAFSKPEKTQGRQRKQGVQADDQGADESAGTRITGRSRRLAMCKNYPYETAIPQILAWMNLDTP